MSVPNQPVEAFISRWEKATGSERANYQLFLTGLCALLDLPEPDPARDDTRDNAYVFERRVTFRHGDGTESPGFIDLYCRGKFVLEAKKVKKSTGQGFDDALLRARGQAEQYARALPAQEGRPPFLLVVDVGNVIELYAEFSRSGATYTPFPDPRSHRIRLADLRDEAVRTTLRAVWTDPLSLDPSRRSAKVTRDIAVQLAKIAQNLEAAGHAPELVAGFLTRCLFSMFAEDVGLLPKRAFVELLESLKDNPAQFAPLVGELWRAMDTGEFSVALRTGVLRFNGKLFKDPHVIALDRDQIALVLDAAKFDWRDVEPAIFGTLLERALTPSERHALGAHYTPRAYVERLVMPTVIEPLREDWKTAQATALVLAGEGKLDDARLAVRSFHKALCEVRVLDPACGSGNFLYVTLEHLKRLEGEVLNQLDELGDTRGRLELEGVSVDPHQFLGIELNPRAAALAELVLWIGYLQWHFRTRGQAAPPQPILKDFHNVECRDAVLAYDSIEYVMGADGKPVTRWDGRTMKKHSVTDEDVPDEAARICLERYVNPRQSEWPKSDYVIGNPPFIGGMRKRELLGDGYVDALEIAWPDIRGKADFVMHWWGRAASLLAAQKLRRFGLITTNSLNQTVNRKVVEHYFANKTAPIHFVSAIPDHPWTQASDGAAVRIAMTVAGRGVGEGLLLISEHEVDTRTGEVLVTLRARRGLISPNLTVGPNVTKAVALKANTGLCSAGSKLYGDGFILDEAEAKKFGLGTNPAVYKIIKSYMNGRDLASHSRAAYVIDCFGFTEAEVREQFPDVFQHLLLKVKPGRDLNRNPTVSANWWLHGIPKKQMRLALSELRRYIVTIETSKHRYFCFLSTEVLPDNKLLVFASDDALHLGVLSSGVHIVWALATGALLEDRPVYVKNLGFFAFPFPNSSPIFDGLIRELAEKLDDHRSKTQAVHPELTLTGIYNVLEKLKTGEALNAKEKAIHERGLVSVLKQLHDELDLAVLEAYGWSDLAPLMNVVHGNAHGDTAAQPPRDDAKRLLDDTLLERLVALNAERAAEEAKGKVRWLRPDFQAQGKLAPKPQQQIEIDTGEEMVEAVAGKDGRLPWPKELPDRIRLVARTLSAAPKALSEDELASHFSGKGPWKKGLAPLVETLVALGRARRVEGGVLGVD